MSEELGGFVVLGAAECSTTSQTRALARAPIHPTTNRAEPVLSHIPSIERDGVCLGP